MAITCLRVPHLTLRIALLDQPELDGLPLLLGTPASGRPVVLDATDEATQKGVRIGTTLREATSLVPDAIVVEPNPAAESHTIHNVLQRLEQLSPLVESDEYEPGCWYIDLTGLDHHFPTPTAAASRMLQCVPPILRPRAGVATSRFTAYIAARIADSTSVHTVPIGGESTFLASAPVTWLPLQPEIPHQMMRLGLRTLGDLAELPPARLAARFGPDGRLAWELANGVDTHIILPRTQIETVVEHMDMPAPIVSRDMFFLGIRQLILRAFNEATLAGKQVRQVTLRAILEDHRSWEKSLVMKEPEGPQSLIRAIELRLQSLELPGPVETLVLQFSGIVRSIAHQEALPLFQPRSLKPIAEALSQMRHRYGASPVYRVVEVEPWSRIPERRHALMTYEL